MKTPMQNAQDNVRSKLELMIQKCDDFNYHRVHAFGTRLISLALAAHGPEFASQVNGPLELFRLHAGISGVSTTLPPDKVTALTAQALDFERSGRPKQAAFCRVINIMLRVTLIDTNSFHTKRAVREAAIKALQAGAKEEDILTAAMLVF